MKTFGEAYRFARKVLAEKSQAEVAKRVGCEQSLISRYELGVNEPLWNTAIKLIAALDIPLLTFCSIVWDGNADVNMSEEFFSVEYFDSAPRTQAGVTYSTSTFTLPVHGIWTRLFHLPATSGRFIFVRASLDLMIPDIIPGDVMVIDRDPSYCVPKAERILAGWGRNEYPEMLRCVRDGNSYILEPSNRRYPLIPIDDFEIHGTVRGVFRIEP